MLLAAVMGASKKKKGSSSGVQSTRYPALGVGDCVSSENSRTSLLSLTSLAIQLDSLQRTVMNKYKKEVNDDFVRQNDSRGHIFLYVPSMASSIPMLAIPSCSPPCSNSNNLENEL